MQNDTNTQPDAREVLAERLVDGLLAGMEVLTVHVGVQTGLYRLLADGPRTAADAADATGLDSRYVREWLEQQAAAELVDVDGVTAAAEQRRYSLCEPHAEVLLDDVSPFHAGAVAPFLVSLGRSTPDVVDAFRDGGGVPYADYGTEVREAIAAFNRPMVTSDLANTWLPATGAVHRAIADAAAPRILDLGCGVGWTSIELARAYPHAVVRGVDLDADSVASARKHAAEAGVADRVSFALADAATFDADEPFDLVTCFETLHDMGDPVGTLRTARRLLRPGGAVLIGDDRGAEAFEVPAEPYERLLYAFSVLHCLPATRAEDPVHAHGTVVRPDDMLGWIADAGFDHGEVLPIDNDLWRFYLATA